MFIIEDYPQQNPYYHSSNDTLDTLNLGFHTNVTRSLVSVIASIGGVPSNEDVDNDGIPNDMDNCPNHPNGSLRGTCTENISGEFVVSYTPSYCTTDGDCGGGDKYCEMDQADNYPMPPNGIGDACDCEGDFNCDQSVDGLDVTRFLADVNKRTPIDNPCTNGDPCDGDFNCDTGVVGTDMLKFIEDWNKRLAIDNPCPPCDPEVPWCVY